MRLPSLALEATALLLGLVLLELVAILVELRTAVVTDWFVSLAPLVWLNASAVALYALLRPLAATSAEGGDRGRGEGVGWRRWLDPRFGVLQRTLRPPRARALWLGVAVLYGLVYSLLQGMVLVDPAGGIPLVATILESPVGYGPALAWSPTPFAGLLLRPYAVAAAAALAVFSGLVFVLLLARLRRDLRAGGAVSGPLAGLAVLCPACLASPAAGLVAAHLGPAASLVGLGTASLFAVNLAVATALLLGSLLLLWMTVAWLSRVLP